MKKLSIEFPKRGLMLLATAVAAAPLYASTEASDAVSNAQLHTYVLVGMAALQMVFIVVLAGIIKNLGRSTDLWSKYRENASKAGLLLALITVPAWASAAGEQAPFLLMKASNLFWMLIMVNIILFAIVIILLGTLRGMIRTMRGVPEEEAVPEAEPDILASLSKSLTNAVDIEHEDEVLLDHEYDGIRELDNALPPWWVWMFYATIVFAVVYLSLYHVLGLMPLQTEEYAIEMEEGRQQVAAYQATLTDRVDENTVVMMTEQKNLDNGQKIYEELCVACHGANGEGGIGPNFTDPEWLHGCDIKSVFTTVKYGVPEKGMISWKTQLKPPEMQNVSSYILHTFQTGSPIAGGKEPQGEVCMPDGTEAAPEEVAPVDSTVTAQLKE